MAGLKAGKEDPGNAQGGGYPVPVYTPRGLKVRLSPEVAFGLLGRLWPRARPAAVLATTEALDEIPVLMLYVGGVVALSVSLGILQAVLCGLAFTLAGKIILWFGVFVVPGIVTAGYWFSYIPVFVYFPGMFVFGYLVSGLRGVVSWGCAYVVASVACQLFDLSVMRLRHAAAGILLTQSEVAFMNAYRLHATRLGVTTDLEIRPDEAESQQALAALEEYSSCYPGHVQ